jgi:hypothetical protein
MPGNRSRAGPDGLRPRHSYRVDAIGGATGANYAFDYREFGGIKVPMSRRIYAYDPARRKVPEPLLVSIDITIVTFR